MRSIHDPGGLVLPITQAMVQQARQFAAEQPSPAKGQQVIQNTLAVLAVDQYLHLMEIPTDLRASDSWNPLLRYGTDVADLKIPNLGHLECRVMDPHRPEFFLPPDLPDDRCGLIGVELDLEQLRANLRGFIPQVKAGQRIHVQQLQSLDRFLSYLSNPTPQARFTALWEILAGELSEGWQPVEALLGTERWKLAASFMALPQTPCKPVTVAKLLNLGMQLGAEQAVLLLAPAEEPEGQVGVRIQVHPGPGQRYLPQALTLALVSQSGVMLKEVHSGGRDNFIQLPYFKCDPEDRFSVRVEWAGIAITESFTCQTES